MQEGPEATTGLVCSQDKGQLDCGDWDVPKEGGASLRKTFESQAEESSLLMRKETERQQWMTSDVAEGDHQGETI